MKLGFTEFSYGYAFTENLIRWSATGPVAAPVFPNLVQEATLGYDVKIQLPGQPLFFQFKLPELMTTNRAREISQFHLAGISKPFFRMPLMRRDLSDQHLHLCNLEGAFPGRVYYASPAMKNMLLFNIAYNAAMVHLRSVLFSPLDIGPLPDDKDHVVSYKAGATTAWRCSEPKIIKGKNFQDLVEQVNVEFSQEDRSPLEKDIFEIREKILPHIPAPLRGAENQIRSRIENRRGRTDGASKDESTQQVVTELLVLRDLTRVGIGVDFVIAQPRDFKKV